MKSVITSSELYNIVTYDNLIIVDANSGANGKEHYNNQHIRNAIHIDLNTELAEIKGNAANGGRHPLPPIEHFSQTLGRKGITKESHIVVYDNNKSANAAARFWWMMRAVGHEKIQVLDATIDEIESAGIPVTNQVTIIEPTEPYPINQWRLPIIDMDTAGKFASESGYCLIDVRDSYRYKGESEPIDLIAGHIPGAINIPFSENLDNTGHFLSSEVLHKKYQSLFQEFSEDKIAIHCGSGVTACHTILAMDYAGLPIPNLYVGSWSEWSRNDKPIGKS